MSDDKNGRVLFVGILVGSLLGLFSFLALFGREAAAEHDFLAGLWMLGCMVAVGLIVKHS